MTNRLNGHVFLDETTDFDGEIKAEVVVLEGEMKGIIHATRKLHLKKGAYIEGEIYTGNFTADQGASCNSEVYMNTKKVDADKELPIGVRATGTENEKNDI